MNKFKQNKILFLFLTILALLLFILNISFGSISIPFKYIFNCFIGNNNNIETWNYIILDYRLPKAITAVLAGIGLSNSGLLMQTLFKNPLAGPDVLGLNSGASLGVAFLVLGSEILFPFFGYHLSTSYSLIIAASIGSFLVLLAVLSISKSIQNTIAVLIVGLMFGSFTNAIVGTLSYFSNAEQLQKFTFWSFGNLGNLSWSSIFILFIFLTVGLFLSFLNIKSLDALLLGKNYAQSLGLKYKKKRMLIVLSTSIITGSVTAFCGPIAFIGLAVPYISRLIFQTSNHQVLFWSTLLVGAITMLLCDTISQLPNNNISLPINAVTSILGAPLVIWLIIKKNKL